MEDVYLKTPDFSAKSIMSYNVGIRPCRKSGVRIEVEYLNNKLIIHNYGYGGSGLTLCWGGANEVIGLLQQEKEINHHLSQAKTVAIFGAGVIGLSMAYELLAQGYHVNLYADAFSPNLTSNVAAGILSAPIIPGAISIEKKQLLNRMFKISMQRFRANVSSQCPEFSGVKYITDYRFEEKAEDIAADGKLVRVHFDNGLVKVARCVHDVGLDGKLFMDDLYAKVKSYGAVIFQSHLESNRQIAALDELIIINCTSLGSRMLFNDHDFLPVRGHLVYLQYQEDIDYSLYSELRDEKNYWVKLYPWSDRLILGGVLEIGKEDCMVEQVVIDRLLKNAYSLFA